MNRPRIRLILPALAALLAGSLALLVWSASVVHDDERRDLAGVVREPAEAEADTPGTRPHATIPPRGALVEAPADQREVRAMVDYCDTASAAQVPELRRVALLAKDPLAAGNAVRALGRLKSVAADAELVALLADPRDRVRDETILALGESGSVSALDELEPLLRAKEQHVRVLAIRAIGRSGTARARTILAAIAEDAAAPAESVAFARAALEALPGR